MERCNEEQKKLLYVSENHLPMLLTYPVCYNNVSRLIFYLNFSQENYGKADQACVAKVKELYKTLDLEV